MRFAVRAVVFDLDGVLVDSESVNVRAAFEAFATAGFPLDARDVASIVGRHPVDYGPELARRHGVPETVLDRVREDQELRYNSLWRVEARLKEGARWAVETVRARRLRTALATNSSRAGVDLALARFDLEGCFDVIVTKDDVASRKPDPEIYTRAARALGVPPNAMIVVEDSVPGLHAAKDAGALCVVVTTPHTPAERLVRADARIASLLELPEHLA